MKFRPCIDLHEGKVKQIVGSTLSENSNSLKENFISDKAADFYAELFRKDNLTGGHVIMLGKGNEGQAVKALQAFPYGLQAGGGITPDNALYFLENGASHVIVTSFVFKDGVVNMENLIRLQEVTGKNRLVLDLSCRKKGNKYHVVTDRWQKFTDFEINEKNLDNISHFCDEFLFHAVDVEGKLKGIDRELVFLLGNTVKIPATYAGGAGTFEDIELVEELGKGKLDLTIGSALDIFGGKLEYRKVVDRFAGKNPDK